MPFKALLERLRHAPAPAPASQAFPRKELAAAVLMIEAAQSDRRMSQEERVVVARLVGERFALPDGEAACLLKSATGEFAAALDDWIFTEAVRENFPENEREDIIEMIWEVIYADRKLSRFEDLFMQRMVESLGVNVQAADRARGCAFARMSAANQRGNEA